MHPHGHADLRVREDRIRLARADAAVRHAAGRRIDDGAGRILQQRMEAERELKRAVDAGKPVYVFVERDVHVEYSTFLKNEGNDSVEYGAVDNVAIYKFLKEVYALPRNNPVTEFFVARDIEDFLREQWAGLFQRRLQEQIRMRELQQVTAIQSAAETLTNLVSYFESRDHPDEAVRNILMMTHPAFAQMRQMMGVKYRLIFTTLEELGYFMEARGYKPVPLRVRDNKEDPERIKNSQYFVFSHELFDEGGTLKPDTATRWNEDWIQLLDAPDPPDDADESANP